MQTFIFLLISSIFSHFTVIFWHLVLYIVVSSNNFCSWYHEALWLLRNLLILDQLVSGHPIGAVFCSYLLWSGILGTDCVVTSLFSSDLVTVSQEIKPIFAEIGSVLTGDCNVAGMRMLLGEAPGQTAERELLQAEQDSSHRAQPWWQLVMQSTSWAECRGSNNTVLHSHHFSRKTKPKDL